MSSTAKNAKIAKSCAARVLDRITGFTRLSAVQHPVNLVNPVQKTSLRVLRALRGGGESGDRHRLDRRVATGIFFDCHRLASTWRGGAFTLPMVAFTLSGDLFFRPGSRERASKFVL